MTSNTASHRMTRDEIRASTSLAGIFALRMLGLFLILPVFSVHAKSMPGGDSATLIGLALGIYGLTQSMGQIPFGIASDRYGRKRVIIVGLIIFACGSFVAAAAPNLTWVIIGRALQGAGAISAAVTALLADTTRDDQRAKAMAMIGASIGLSFAASLVLSPLLYKAVGMDGIFGLTGVLALLAIGVVSWIVPVAPVLPKERVPFSLVLGDRDLMRLNVGVFVLHAVQMAMFVVMPGALLHYLNLPLAQHWQVYLPVVIASFVLMLPPLLAGERRGRAKQVFIGAIALLLCVQLGMWHLLTLTQVVWWLPVSLLLAFFVAFNLLEASQPAMVSRLAPPSAKGAALGVYNTAQSLGLFCGGALGGLLVQHAGAPAVFIVGSVLVGGWLIIAANMKNPSRRPAAGASAA